MKRKYWTQKDIDYLTLNYSDTITSELCEVLNRKRHDIFNKAFSLRLKKSDEYLKRYVHIINNKEGEKFRFKKGFTPWNKGMKGLNMGGVETQFKKGNKPKNTKGKNHFHKRRDGYWYRKISDSNWILEHNRIWIESGRTIPEGKFLVFKDGNPDNICLDNLQLVTRRQNMIRNSYHRYPEDLRKMIQLKGAINRQLNKLKNG